MRFSSAFLLFGAALLLGCNTGPKCYDNGDCGEKQACIDNRCQDVECVTSSQCPIEHYCREDVYICVSGCRDDSDCKAGRVCEGDTCVDAECTDTHVDCSIGEVCQNGSCVDAGEGHCKPCSSQFDCPADFVCVMWDIDRAYCAMNCTSTAECPSGYECTPLMGGGYACVADCPNLP